MVHIDLVGKLFKIDLRAPNRPARVLHGTNWIDHFLTNEQILFNPDAHRIEEDVLRREVEAAGFKLVGTGDFFRHPEDTRDSPSGRPTGPVAPSRACFRTLCSYRIFPGHG